MGVKVRFYVGKKILQNMSSFLLYFQPIGKKQKNKERIWKTESIIAYFLKTFLPAKLKENE